MSRRRRRRLCSGMASLGKDIEADEATFDRRDISQDVELKHLIQSKDCVMMWGAVGGHHSARPSRDLGALQIAAQDHREACPRTWRRQED